MESVRRYIESLCILGDALQQHGGKSFLAPTQYAGFQIALKTLSRSRDGNVFVDPILYEGIMEVLNRVSKEK